MKSVFITSLFYLLVCSRFTSSRQKLISSFILSFKRPKTESIFFAENLQCMFLTYEKIFISPPNHTTPNSSYRGESKKKSNPITISEQNIRPDQKTRLLRTTIACLGGRKLSSSSYRRIGIMGGLTGCESRRESLSTTSSCRFSFKRLLNVECHCFTQSRAYLLLISPWRPGWTTPSHHHRFCSLFSYSNSGR